MVEGYFLHLGGNAQEAESSESFTDATIEAGNNLGGVVSRNLTQQE